MNIKTKYSSRSADVSLQRIFYSLIIILFTFGGMLRTDTQIVYCHQSILSLPATKMTLNISWSQCSIPYEECRCSVSSNRFNDSTNCINDIQAMSSYILPPISLVTQLYVIYDLFSSTGHYWCIFLCTVWLTGLLALMMIAIHAQKMFCLYFHLNWFFCSSCAFALFPTFYLIIHHHLEDLSSTHRQTNRHRRLMKNDDDPDREVRHLVIVS